MPAKQILIVDDDDPIRDMIAFGLFRHGFEVCHAPDAERAQLVIKNMRPDLAIIDCMLPGMPGLDLTRLIKRDSATSHIPVIIVSARADEQDKLLGFESGADDYVTKPFSTRELLARIQALLRRTAGQQTQAVMRANDLVLDSVKRQVTVGERFVELGALEFRLLSFLMANPERAYDRSQLLDRVWGTRGRIDSRAVDVLMSRLRSVLRPFKCDLYLQTVHGTGYRFSTRTD